MRGKACAGYTISSDNVMVALGLILSVEALQSRRVAIGQPCIGLSIISVVRAVEHEAAFSADVVAPPHEQPGLCVYLKHGVIAPSPGMDFRASDPPGVFRRNMDIVGVALTPITSGKRYRQRLGCTGTRRRCGCGAGRYRCGSGVGRHRAIGKSDDGDTRQDSQDNHDFEKVQDDAKRQLFHFIPLYAGRLDLRP